MDAFSIAVSVALQYGVPLDAYVSKFTNMRFDPAGLTDDPDIRIAQSVMDYMFRRLALDYLPYERGPSSASCPRPSAPPPWPARARVRDGPTSRTPRRWPSRPRWRILAENPAGRDRPAGPGTESAPPPQVAARLN